MFMNEYMFAYFSRFVCTYILLHAWMLRRLLMHFVTPGKPTLCVFLKSNTYLSEVYCAPLFVEQ